MQSRRNRARINAPKIATIVLSVLILVLGVSFAAASTEAAPFVDDKFFVSTRSSAGKFSPIVIARAFHDIGFNLSRKVRTVRAIARPLVRSIPIDLASGITYLDKVPELRFDFPDASLRTPKSEDFVITDTLSREIVVVGAEMTLIGDFVLGRYVPHISTPYAFSSATLSSPRMAVASIPSPRLIQSDFLPSFSAKKTGEKYVSFVLGAGLASAAEDLSTTKVKIPFVDRLSLSMYCSLASLSSSLDASRCDYETTAAGRAEMAVDSRQSAVKIQKQSITQATSTPTFDAAKTFANGASSSIVYLTKYITKYVTIEGTPGRDGRDGKDGLSAQAGVSGSIVNNVVIPSGFGSYAIPSYTSPSTAIGISTIGYLKDTTIDSPVINGGTATNLSLFTPTLRNAVFNGLSLFNDAASFSGGLTTTTLVAASSTLTNATLANSTTTNAYISTLVASSSTLTDLVVTNSTSTNAYVSSLTIGTSTAGTLTLNGALNVGGTSTLATTTVTDFVASRATSTSLFSTLLTAVTGFFTNLTATNATTTNLVATNSTTTNAYDANLLVDNSTTTNAFIQSLRIGNQQASDALFTNATTTTFFSTSSVLVSATATNFFTQNLAVGNASVQGNQSITGAFNVSGTSTLGANVFLNGNVVIGTSTNETLTVNALVNSNFVPAQNKIYDIGSPSFYWRTMYADTINVNTLAAASSTISGTSNENFTINSDNGTSDTENASLIFFRGLVTPNALLRWNAGGKRFESNMSFRVQNETPSVGTTTLTVQSGAGQLTTNLFELANYAGTKLSVFNADGWLGLGSSTPGSMLTVTGASSLATTTITGLLTVNGNTNITQGGILTVGDKVIAPGEIGAGTSSPSGKISIQNTLPNQVAFLIYGSSTQTAPLIDVFDYPGSNQSVFRVSATGTLSAASLFLTNGLSASTFTTTGTSTFATAGGNVGIGSTTPGYKLSVVGDGYFGGNLTATGTLNVTGSTQLTSLTASGAVSASSTLAVSGATTLYSTLNMLADILPTTDITRSLGSNALRFLNTFSQNIYASSSVVTNASSTGLTATNLYSTTGTITNLSTTNASTTHLTVSNNAYFGGNTGIWNSSGNVGIGTANPSSLLHVTGTTNDGTSLITANQAGTGRALYVTRNVSAATRAMVNFAQLSATGGSESVLDIQQSTAASRAIKVTADGNTDLFSVYGNGNVYASGNVGIGTTSPNNLLHVYTNSAADVDGLKIQNANASGYIGLQLDRSAIQRSALLRYSTAGTNDWQVGVAYNAGGANSSYSIGTTNALSGAKMVIDTAGNVGIGTTSPASKLNVYGKTIIGTDAGNVWYPTVGDNNLYVGSNTSPAINTGGTISLGGRYRSLDNGQISYGSIAGLKENGSDANANGFLAFYTSNDVAGASGERMRITSSGNVGIGTTTPGYKLSVIGDGYFGGNLIATGTLNITGQTTLATASSTGLTVTGGTYLATVSGNVGIGTTNPNDKLDVNGSMRISGPSGNLWLSGAGSIILESGGKIGYNSTVSNTGLYVDSTPQLKLQVAGSDKLTVLTSGNVGIGTTTPMSILSIASTSPFITLTNSTGENADYGRASGITFSGTAVNGTQRAVAQIAASQDADSYEGYFSSQYAGQLSFRLSNYDGNVFEAAKITPAGIYSFGRSFIVATSTTGATKLSNNLLVIRGNEAGTTGSFINFNSNSGRMSLANIGNSGVEIKTSAGIVLTASAEGNVGIGTTTPLNSLTVQASTTYNPFMVANSSGSPLFNILAGGNVGIGSTTPGYKLSVIGDGYFGGNVIATGTLAVTGASTLTGAVSASSTLAVTGATTLYSTLNASGHTTITTASSTGLTVTGGAYLATSAGNVGIGTAAPGYKLDVNGRANVVGDANDGTPDLLLNGTGGFGASSGQIRAYNPSGNLHHYWDDTSFKVVNVPFQVTDGSQNVKISLNATGDSYFNGSGNVGIGTTTPISLLTVASSTATGTSNLFSVGTSSTIFNVLANGNVGVGTIAPTAKLHIEGGSGNTNIKFTNTTTGATGGYIGQLGGNDFYVTNQTAAGKLFLATNDTARLTVASSGEVGINTTGPTALLQVAGTYTTSNGSAISFAPTFDSSATVQQNVINSQTTVRPTGASLGALYGILNLPTINTSAANITNVHGNYARIDAGSGYTGRISAAFDFTAGNPSNSSLYPYGTFAQYNTDTITNGNGTTTGTISNYGFRFVGATASSSGSATINNYGFQATLPSGSPSGGTTNNYGLHLSGNGGTSNGGTVNNYSIYNSSTANSYFAGNVGIGTTTPGAKLHVTQTTGALGFSSGIWIQNNFGDTTVGQGAGITLQNHDVEVGGIYGIRQEDNWKGALAFYTHTSDSGNTFGTTFTEKMRIQDNGNVGIGTTTPGAKLDVYGGGGTNGVRIATTGANSPFLTFLNATNNAGFRLAGSLFQYGTGDTSSFTPQISIDSTGNVGIGEAAPGSKLSVSGGATIGASYDTTAAPTNGLIIEGNVGIGTTTPGSKLQVNGGTGSLLKLANGANYMNFTGAGSGNIDITGFENNMRVFNNYTGGSLHLGAGNDADRMVIASNGNVGIGTTTPNSLLTLVGGTSGGYTTGISISRSGNVTNQWELMTASDNSLYIGHGNGASKTNDLVVTTGGNVGIGTTSPAYKLDVAGGGIRSDLTTGGYLDLSYAGAVKGNLTVDSSKFYVNTQTTNTIINANGGNVGIGTTSPTYKLQVAGTSYITNGFSAPDTETGYRLKFNDNGGIHNDAGIGLDGISGGEQMFFNTISGFYFNYGTAGKKIVFDSNGNVGIGTTSPDSLLNLVGADPILLIKDSDTSLSTANSRIRLAESGAGGTTDNYWDIKADGTINSDFGFSIGSSAVANAFFINRGTGNVGIGTTSPSQKLHVYTAGTSIVKVDAPAANEVHYRWAKDNTDKWFMYMPASSGDLRIYDNASVGDMVTFKSGGNVGIGTTSPGSKLHVAGSGVPLLSLQTNTASTGLASAYFYNSAGSARASLNYDTADDAFKIGDASAYRITLLQGGNVGIGTTVPGKKLQIGDTDGTLAVYNNSDFNGSTGGIAQFGMNATAGDAYVQLGANQTSDYSYMQSTSAGVGTYPLILNPNGGNVGVGTTNPGTKLQVLGSDTLPVYVSTSDATASYIRFLTGSTVSRGAFGYSTAGAVFLNSALNTANMTILDGGNVGIGTTTPTLGKLSVNGIIHGYGGNNGVGEINLDNGASATRLQIRNETGGWNIKTVDTSDLNLFVNNTLGRGVTIKDTSGNVGIGTTTPVAKLNVYSPSGDSGVISRFESAYASGGYNYYQDAANGATRGYVGYGPVLFDTGDNTVFGMRSQGALTLATNGNVRQMTILTSGNVGIGTTGPQYKLSVPIDSGTIGAYSDATHYGVITPYDSGGYMTFDHLWSTNSGGYRFRNGGSSVDLVTIQGTGNVGIGTTSPQNKLHIASGAAAAYAQVTTDTTGHTSSDGALFGYANGQTALTLMNQEAAGLILGTAGTEWLRINSTGNVGIGTTSPISKLDVWGNLNVGTSSSPALFVNTATGKVGIGTDAPVTRFDSFIAGTATNDFNIRNGSVSAKIFVDSGAAYFGSGSVHPVLFTINNVEKARIDTAGNVGIGTTTPNSKLDIWSTTSSSDVDIFRIASSVGSANNIKFRIDSDGDVFTDGATTIGSPADIAESYSAMEAVDAGTVVAFSTTTVSWSATHGSALSAASSTDIYEISGVRKAHDGYEAVGVVSTRPGLHLGADIMNGVPVALSGRVPVKVTTENGEVRIGDYLTVSLTRPGYAMKLTGEGKSIGRALSDYTTSGDKVMMYVESGYQKLDMAGRYATTTGMLTTGNVDLNANGVAIYNIKSLASANGTWSIDENGRIVAKVLCLEDVCIDKTQLSNMLNSTGQTGVVAGTSTTSTGDTGTTTATTTDTTSTSTSTDTTTAAPADTTTTTDTATASTNTASTPTDTTTTTTDPSTTTTTPTDTTTTEPAPTDTTTTATDPTAPATEPAAITEPAAEPSA